MEQTKETALDRVLKEEDFKKAQIALDGGKESVKNPEIVKNLIEGFKGQTLSAPIEAIITSAIFLNSRELMGVIETLKHLIRVKLLEEAKDSPDGNSLLALAALAMAMKDK